MTLSRPRRPALRLRRFIVGSISVMGAWVFSLPTMAASPGLSTFPAGPRPQSVSVRSAIIIVPAAPGASPRSAVADADEQALRTRLQALGFDVYTIGPSDRPEMDRLLRDAAGRITSGDDVVVFTLGLAISDAEDIRVAPADAPAGLADAQDRLETEGLRLSEVLRRISLRLPRSLVVIVDECARTTAGDESCAVDAAAKASGASIIAARRKSGGAGRAPLAARASLREDLLPLISKEDLKFSDLYTALDAKLAGTNVTLDATSVLNGAFAFTPAGFFAKLSNDCNKVDPNANPVSLKTANLEPQQRACDAAVARYPFSQYFVQLQSVLAEQRAYQRAVGSCSDQVAISAFGSDYPTSRYRRIVDDFAMDCGRQRDAADRERAQQAERERLLLENQARAQEEARQQREREAQERAAAEQRQRDEQARAQAQQNAQQASQALPQQIARNFVARYYWASSSEGEASGARLADLYASSVSFYGETRTAYSVLAEKYKYNERWPKRRFALQPNSLTANCDQTYGVCKVTGVVNWDFESGPRNARSRGASSFEFGIAGINSSPRVISESSNVVQRY